MERDLNVPGNSNLNLTGSYDYQRYPVRFAVENGSVKDETVVSYINIPQIQFPPMGTSIQLETVFVDDGKVVDQTYDSQAEAENDNPFVAPAPAFWLQTKNLAEAPLTAGGAGQSQLVFGLPASGAAYINRKVNETSPGEWTVTYDYVNTRPVNNSVIHHRFPYTDMNFSFQWTVVGYPFENLPALQDAHIQLEFVIIPDPYYSKRT